MKQTFNDYIAYLLTHIVKDVENFNHWWMLFIVPAVIWFMIIIFKYFLLTLPLWFPVLIFVNLMRSLFKRSEWNMDDVESAFDEGVHEGKLREHYKNDNTGMFSPSGLEAYSIKYKKKRKKK